MKVFTQVSELNSWLSDEFRKVNSIGFVPTMGSLHEGHISLVREASKNNDISLVSIFVNPLQFTESADYENYPRNIEADIQLLEKVNCDFLFCPTYNEVYHENERFSKIDGGVLAKVLEGKFRPGHFDGVEAVLTKLFNLVRPNKAYFGEKDLQQCFFVKKLVENLLLDIEIVCLPTIRESNGLAMSSRNSRLSHKQRGQAGLIYKHLTEVKEKLISNGDFNSIKNEVIQALENKSDFKIDYFELVKLPEFLIENKLSPSQNFALCIAVYLNDIRLIDNVIIMNESNLA